ncbi:MAG: ribonuclease P protein component [Chloroflexota bacterium]|nr:ribonuclease P protein component [Chloroflexota bacterium]
MISVEVIRKSKEFLEVISNGNKFTNSGMVIYYLDDNDPDKLRIGISIKKQVGNSVVRNKLRRQIKSLLRDELFKLNGFSIVLIVMNNNQVLNYSSIKDILDKFNDFISKDDE